MNVRQIHENRGQKTFAIVFDTGDEVMEGLTGFAKENGLDAAVRYGSDLRGVVGSSATAYGYTLTVWSTGAVLSHAYGPPSPRRCSPSSAGRFWPSPWWGPLLSGA